MEAIAPEKKEVTSEQFFRKMIESFPLGTFLGASDTDANTMYANPAMCKMLGYASEEFRGDFWKSIIHPDDREIVFARWAYCVESNLVFDEKFRYITGDGEALWARVIISFIQEDNININIVGVIQDISAEKKAEDDLAISQAQLVQAAKLASLGEIATGVAHELNQPLSIMDMCADIALRSLKQNDTGEVEKRLSMMKKEIERSAQIIDHLRAFSYNTRKQNYKIISLKEVVNGALILIKEQFTLLGIAIKTEFSDELFYIKGDAIRIEQVLTNVLINARDAMISSAKKIISIRIYEKSGSPVLEVTDTGTGIDKASLPLIFDPFYTSKAQGKGTGLGLSISLNLIKEHGGNMTVNSEPGVGTTFKILLPRYTERNANVNSSG